MNDDMGAIASPLIGASAVRRRERPIRLFLVHADRLHREVLSGALRRCQELVLLGASGHVDDGFLRRSSRLDAEVVLIDVGRDLDRVRDVIRELRQSAPGTRVVPMGVRQTADVVLLIEAGAHGYVTEEASLGQLVAAVKESVSDRAFCSPSVAAAVFDRLTELSGDDELGRDHEPTGGSLTAREAEVLVLVSEGMRNKEIARQLGIALPTVKNHVHRILHKLGASGRREAIRLACDRGILAMPPIGR